MATVYIPDPVGNTETGQINTTSGPVNVTRSISGRVDAYGKRKALIAYLVTYQRYPSGLASTQVR